MLSDRLRELANQRFVPNWRSFKLTQGILNSIKYVIFRSRGFFSRKANRFVRNVAYLGVIAALGSRELFYLAAMAWLVFMILSAIQESVLAIVRGSTMSSRILPFWFLFFFPSTFVVIGFGWLFWASPVVWSEQTLGLFLLTSAILTLAELALMARTYHLQSRVRVYVSPLLIFGGTLGNIVILLVMLFLKVENPIYFLIVQMGFRIFDQWIVVRSVIDREKLDLIIAKKTSLNDPLFLQDSQELRTSDGSRILATTSPFLLMFCTLIASGLHGVTQAQIVTVWGVIALGVVIGRRPLQAYSVDVIQSVRKHQWITAIALTFRAARLAGILWLLYTAIVLFPIFGWIFGSTAQVFWTSLPFLVRVYACTVIGTTIVTQFAIFRQLDQSFHWQWVGWRLFAGATIVVMALLDVRLRFMFFMCSGVELSLACYFLYKTKTLDGLRIYRSQLAKLLRDSSRSRTSAGTVAMTSQSFVKGLKLAKKGIERIGVGHQFFLVHLRQRYSSEAKMRRVLKTIEQRTRASDLKIAIDPQTILLWCPKAGAEHQSLLQERFVTSFPLLINSIQVVDQHQIVSMWKKKIDATDLTFEPLAFGGWQLNQKIDQSCEQIDRRLNERMNSSFLFGSGSYRIDSIEPNGAGELAVDEFGRAGILKFRPNELCAKSQNLNSKLRSSVADFERNSMLLSIFSENMDDMHLATIDELEYFEIQPRLKALFDSFGFELVRFASRHLSDLSPNKPARPKTDSSTLFTVLEDGQTPVEMLLKRRAA